MDDMALEKIMVSELRKRLNYGIEPLTLSFGLSSDEREEVLNNDFQLLLSIIADQSVNSSIAWHISFQLKERLGCKELTPKYLLEHSEAVRDAIKRKPSLHRYPNKMADYFMSFSKELVDHFSGNASGLLNSNDFNVLIDRLVQIKGISRKKAGLTCLILEIDKSRHINGLTESYALMDSHVQKFLKRNLKVERPVSENEATNVFREIYPNNPALVSTVVWDLDREK